ncbi:hypothetical protein [Nostoc sp.]
MQPEQIPLQMFTWFVFQHSIKNPKSGFSPSIPTTFRFSIRRVHAFHRATTASCDHFSGFGTGAAELSPSFTAFTSPSETELWWNSFVLLN